MDALATVTDLSARGIDTTNTTRVAALLASASQTIRDAAGVPISKTTSTISLAGSTEQWLRLPASPVHSVGVITLDDATVTDALLREGSLWRARGWQDGLTPSLITLTLTHGYDPVPADIIDLCCSLVAAGLAAAEDGYDPLRGLTSLSIDDYREGYTQGENEVLTPMELPTRTRDWLRQRFGGGTHVVRSH